MGSHNFISLNWGENKATITGSTRAYRFFSLPLRSEVSVRKCFFINYYQIRKLCREKCPGLDFNQDKLFREMLWRLKKKVEREGEGQERLEKEKDVDLIELAWCLKGH